MTQNNDPFVRTMAPLFVQEVPVFFNIKCHGCGEPMTKLPQEEADKLRKLESFEGLDALGIGASGCRSCKIVIFEHEQIG